MAFALTPASAPAEQGLPGDWLQVRSEGVDLGDANVEIIDFVGDPERVVVTRGVGENAHVITVRVAAAPAPEFIYPGWMTDIDNADSTPLYANSGAGQMFFGYFGEPPTSNGDVFAGIEGYTSGVVVWTPSWTPAGADPSPTVTPLSGGRVKVTYRGVPNFPYYDRNDGLLVLSATVDGVPCDGTIEVASGPNTLYYPFAWQPTP